MTSENFGIPERDLQYLAKLADDVQRFAGPSLMTIRDLEPSLRQIQPVLHQMQPVLHQVLPNIAVVSPHLNELMGQLADAVPPSLPVLLDWLPDRQAQVENWMRNLPKAPEQVAEAEQASADIQTDPEKGESIRRLVSGIKPEDLVKLSRDARLVVAAAILFYIFQAALPDARTAEGIALIGIFFAIYVVLRDK
jgi:hypothetical protein